MKKTRTTSMDDVFERDGNTIEYQFAAFELDLSDAFCARLIEMGYGHDTGETINGRPFIQISVEEVPEIPGISKETIVKFMEGNTEEIPISDIFRLLWEVGIVLEPHVFMGQSIYSKKYDYSVKPK